MGFWRSFPDSSLEFLVNSQGLLFQNREKMLRKENKNGIHFRSTVYPYKNRKNPVQGSKKLSFMQHVIVRDTKDFTIEMFDQKIIQTNQIPLKKLDKLLNLYKTIKRNFRLMEHIFRIPSIIAQKPLSIPEMHKNKLYATKYRSFGSSIVP